MLTRWCFDALVALSFLAAVLEHSAAEPMGFLSALPLNNAVQIPFAAKSASFETQNATADIIWHAPSAGNALRRMEETSTLATHSARSTLPTSAQCADVEPPPSWTNPTCWLQLFNTVNCTLRKNWQLNDGYCHKTCGVCGELEGRKGRPNRAWNDLGLYPDVRGASPVLRADNGMDYVNWSLCNASFHSNLAGAGPDVGENSIRYYRVATAGGGQALDLVITAATSYIARDVSINGLVSGDSCFGAVNLRAKPKVGYNSVTLLLGFYLTGTNKSVTLEQFYLTVCDFDSGKVAREHVTFHPSVTELFYVPDHEMEISGNMSVLGVSFSSTEPGSGKDNPKDPMNLTAFHQRRAVMVSYTKSKQIRLTLAVEGGKAGRNFVFAGFSNLGMSPPASEQPRRPTSTPTPQPTGSPTASPTLTPTPVPTTTPTRTLTFAPTPVPTAAPTGSPTLTPTSVPTATPTRSPTLAPTRVPTATPTREPTPVPTPVPTRVPTATPTTDPTFVPTLEPTAAPTKKPTSTPTPWPTRAPTESPTPTPTPMPTATPTRNPTATPMPWPSAEPTMSPMPAPTRMPIAAPTDSPTPAILCSDVEPPSTWSNPSCLSQMLSTDNCAKRRNGALNDGLCSRTCGLCEEAKPQTVQPTLSPTLSPTAAPTRSPTFAPTPLPTPAPTEALTPAPPCYDVEPPSTWRNPTCVSQLQNTDTCGKRREGQMNDGLCHKTCGICCDDVQPPAHWSNPTCLSQLLNTDSCAKRRSGELRDGLCHRTCGICCDDVAPPSTWGNPTCLSQLLNTDNCAKRRSGELRDGLCHRTCGLCCMDMEPPSHWSNPTCLSQLLNTDSCAKRRSGELNDGLCSKTCGVCGDSPAETTPPTQLPTPTPTTYPCYDVEPPATWSNPTCLSQLLNTDSCAKRRSGELGDGFCHRTCGVCVEADGQTASPMVSPTLIP